MATNRLPIRVISRGDSENCQITGDIARSIVAQQAWAPGDTGIKLTAALSRVPGLLRDNVRGSAGTGVLYAGLPAGTEPDEVARIVGDLRTAARDAGGHAVVLTAPPAVRERVDMWGPVDGLALMRRVKQQFDPDGGFAAGRFVGGI